MTKVTELKSDNIHRIRECFYDGLVWTKNELAGVAGLSLAATTNILQLLLKNKEIELVGEAKSTGGRKSKQYKINKDYYHIGILSLKRNDADYYFIIKSIDLLGNILSENRIISKSGKIKELIEVISSFINKDAKIGILVLSIPGVCKEGKVSICDFEDFEMVDLAYVIKDHFNLEVVIENDVNVACVGFGKHYSNAKNLVLMYQPRIKYIGCGILIDHQLCRGASNFAGELSYLPFLTHRQQDEMLKDDPNDLLLKQLVTICCVINPEVVGVCSDVINIFDERKLENYLTKEHWPKIINVNDLDKLICDGLTYLGIKVLINKIRKGAN